MPTSQLNFNAPVYAPGAQFGCREKSNLQLFNEVCAEVESLITDENEHLLCYLGRVKDYCNNEDIIAQILSSVSLNGNISTLSDSVKSVVLTAFTSFCIRCIDEDQTISLSNCISNGIELIGKSRKLITSSTIRPVEMVNLCSRLKRWLKVNPQSINGGFYLSNIDSPDCRKCDEDRGLFESELNQIFSNIFSDFLVGNIQPNSFYELEISMGFSVNCGECSSNISLIKKSRGKL